MHTAGVRAVVEPSIWLGFSVYPDTKMDEERMVALLRAYGPEQVLVNSAADWGRSDPLKTRRVGDLMLAEGFTEDEVDRVLWRNPVAFYGLSGRLNLDITSTDTTHEGNSILRGGA
jgi:predicted metal-dependent TIM-barrel fold hydrolase